MMINAIQEYITYLHDVRRISYNTEVSYERDLRNAADYFAGMDITDMTAVSETDLQSYVLHLEQNRKSAATVSRSVASLRSFYQYLNQMHRIASDPSRNLKSPKVDRKAPEVLSAEEIRRLMEQPNSFTDKGIRDKAMLGLLYKSGIRVGELVHLKLGDVNLDKGYLICTENDKTRNIRIDSETGVLLADYMQGSRKRLLKGRESAYLFCNCAGTPLSRQGLWKVLKAYAADADLNKAITPHAVRSSGAAAQTKQNKVSRITNLADRQSGVTGTGAPAAAMTYVRMA